VVANDVDRERLQMMIARQKPLRSPRLLATNYPGQNFPAVGARASSKEGEMRDEGAFDRVLCDVPCRYLPLFIKAYILALVSRVIHTLPLFAEKDTYLCGYSEA